MVNGVIAIGLCESILKLLKWIFYLHILETRVKIDKQSATRLTRTQEKISMKFSSNLTFPSVEHAWNRLTIAPKKSVRCSAIHKKTLHDFFHI